ncbi:MAG TPA: hypothetical protein VHX86_16960 [Tepidisphaeraceae bacterium]|nr:hypothetical protein [Tepidisphaeraceae bacterium]
MIYRANGPARNSRQVVADEAFGIWVILLFDSLGFLGQNMGMASAVKCACPKCQCAVKPGNGVVRDGKTYCSRACAYECTSTTCVCVHDRCDEKPHQ